jgi:hypothetical protein
MYINGSATLCTAARYRFQKLDLLKLTNFGNQINDEAIRIGGIEPGHWVHADTFLLTGATNEYSVSYTVIGHDRFPRSLYSTILNRKAHYLVEFNLAADWWLVLGL